jgi:hypothetical protein
MFVTAVERASKFTGPIVISSRTVGGKVTSGCGSFVIVNDEGWILTAAHIFNADRVLTEQQKAHTEYLEKRKEIEERTDLNINKKRKLISRLNFSDDWLSNVSFWWGQDGLSCKQVHMNLLADVAITKLRTLKQPRMRRFRNLATHPSTCLLVAHYARLDFRSIRSNRVTMKRVILSRLRRVRFQFPDFLWTGFLLVIR